MDLSAFRTSRRRELEGTWVPLDGAEDGASIKLARVGNPKYRELMQTRLKPFRRAMRAGTLPDDTLERVTTEVLADSVVLDWRNLLLDGEKIPYSRDATIRLLSDPDLRDFRDFIVEAASDIAHYREQDLEDAEKN